MEQQSSKGIHTKLAFEDVLLMREAETNALTKSTKL